MKTTPIKKEYFIGLLQSLKITNDEEINFLYEIYESIIDTINQVTDLASAYEFTPINHINVVLYLINEYRFTTSTLPIEKKREFFENEEFYNQLGSFVADKYLTNEQLKFEDEAFLNKFNPPISTLELYLNFSLRILENLKINDENQNLLKDLLLKAFKMGKCILELLVKGFETEAFSTWRTLHENECLILVLVKNGQKVFNEYFKHIQYNLAFRGQIHSVEETDKIFEQIKSEMKKHDLKSKDMKKFIEYGYLYKIKNIDDFPHLKLNFRDGVETVAGLSEYSKIYEMASEIAHSSPLLFYSNRSYFFGITIINLYESFFRLEKVFDIFYRQIAQETEYDNFLHVKTTYLSQLQIIHRIFVERMVEINHSQKNK